MSNRCSSFVFRFRGAVAGLAVPMLLPLFGLNSAVIAQSPETNTLISMTVQRNLHPGGLATIDINLDRYGAGPAFAGFKFLINYDTQLLTLVGAAPGALIDCSAWEYFSYQTDGLAPEVVCVRLTAIADLPGNGDQPSSYLAGRSGTLARLQFLAASDTAYDCYFFPVNFYWNDCADNSVSSLAGDSLYVVKDAKDYYYWSTSVPPTSLPSVYGLPDSCLAGPIAGATPGRQLSFRHGGVDFACSDTVDQRGDMNLNGIANEIADYNIYLNYLLEGFAALNPDPIFRLAQIAASDVNADGATLTFRDFVYLYRVVIGDAVPFPKPRPLTPTAAFTQNTTSNYVRVDFPGELAGARLVFDGEIAPTFFVPAEDSFANHVVFDGVNTRIVMEPRSTISHPSGIWFTYIGPGQLNSVVTADWFDSEIPCQIFVTAGAGACGDGNGDGQTSISDAVLIISYIFAEGHSPFDVRGGDVDCDALVTISDAVYLVNYIFAGGPAPCGNCP